MVEEEKAWFKWRVETQGSHVHVVVFSRYGNTTWASCGKLVFTVEEWPRILKSIPPTWRVESYRFPEDE